MSVLFVVTNTKKFADKKKDCGWYLPTVCFAYRAFIDAGFKVQICSPIGALAPLDPESKELWDFTTCTEFLDDSYVMGLIEASKNAKLINPDKYQVVFFAGGFGAIYDCLDSPHLNSIVASVYEKGGIISGVGNGVVGLVNVKLSNGCYLIQGKKVTGFTNVELERSGNAHLMPFKLQDKISAQGGIFVEGPPVKINVVQHGSLVTGQNPTSTAETANTVIQAFKDLKPPMKKKADVNVLIMLTNTGEVAGRKTGWYLPTVVYPYKACIEAGFKVTFCSPNGGNAPLDPESVQLWDHSECREFLKDQSVMNLIKQTVPVKSIDASKYNILHFAGGFGMLYDCVGNSTIDKLVSDIYENEGGVLSCIAQGVAGLLDVELSFGDMLIESQHITAFTNEEVNRTSFADIVPFSLQDRLLQQEAMFQEGTPVKEHVVVAKSGRIVTGQNPNSSIHLADALIRTYKDYEASNI